MVQYTTVRNSETRDLLIDAPISKYDQDKTVMKLFIEGPNLEEIRQAKAWGILDGITTDRSSICRLGVPHKEHMMKIIDIAGDVPVFTECVESDVGKLEKEAREIASWAPNIIVTVPMTTNAMEVVKHVSPRGIRFNVSLIFSLAHALIAAKAGASFLSFLSGRLDDSGSQESSKSIINAVDMLNACRFTQNPEVAVGAIRSPLQVIESVCAGAHIAVIPFKTRQMLFKHPLSEIGIERFYADYLKVTGGAKSESAAKNDGLSIEDKARVEA